MALALEWLDCPSGGIPLSFVELDLLDRLNTKTFSVRRVRRRVREECQQDHQQLTSYDY
jgi:hypothetical protein